jgi:hypothetical protein
VVAAFAIVASALAARPAIAMVFRTSRRFMMMAPFVDLARL